MRPLHCYRPTEIINGCDYNYFAPSCTTQMSQYRVLPSPVFPLLNTHNAMNTKKVCSPYSEGEFCFHSTVVLQTLGDARQSENIRSHKSILKVEALVF
jgi:hypothetical protein